MGAIKRDNDRAWQGVGLGKGRQCHLEQTLALQLLPGLGQSHHPWGSSSALAAAAKSAFQAHCNKKKKKW